MIIEQIIVAWVLGIYLACTVGGLAFRGWVDSMENDETALHFIWPVYFIAIPIGFFYLAGKAASHGLRILKIRKEVKP